MRHQRLLKLEIVVNSVFMVNVKEKCRQRDIVNARIIFSKIAREHFYKFTEIGRFLGVNHATIIHYIKSFDNYSATDKALTRNYTECVNMFNDDTFDVNISLEDNLKKQVISLKKQINSLNSELTLSKTSNSSSDVIRLLDLFKMVKDRTRVGTEDFIKTKLNSFYNGVYDY